MISNFKMFQVASEHFYFWLIALKFFCEAESLLNISCDSQLALDRQISDACAKYHKGITTLKVKKKSTYWPSTYLWFLWHSVTSSISTPPWMGC